MTITDQTPLVPVLDVTRVLVPLDGSLEGEAAIDAASTIAASLGAPLTLFCWHWGAGGEWLGRQYLEEVRERRSLDCDLQAGWTSNSGVARPLVAEADRVPGTLVCMATHARSGLGALVNGSVAEEILRRRFGPLLLVGPVAGSTKPDLTLPVVVPLDGSAFSEAAIPVGRAWAQRLGVALELVTCVEPTSADGLRWSDRDVIDSGYLVRHAREHGASSWEILHSKRPGRAVAAYAHAKAGLIVASTHGRTGLARIVTGSVAVRIVHQAPCPVLLVSPDGLAEPAQG